jgi:TonB-linked SusC/RagA family outer membrane protein
MAGVIVITTKKGGKADGKIGVTYSGKFTWSPVSYFPDLQNVYGQGTLGAYDGDATGSWGAKMSSSTTVANWWDGTTNISYIGTENPWTEFYRTGSSQSNNVTLAGGKADNPFRLTIGYDNTNSVVKTSSIKRTSIDYVATNKLTDWLKLDIKANYVNTTGKNRQNRGAYGTSYSLLTMPRSIKVSDLAEHWLDETEVASGGYGQINWHEVSANCQNPYFIQNMLDNKDSQNKFFGVGSLTVNLLPNLTLKVKDGITWAGVTSKESRKYKNKGFNVPSFDMKESTTVENNLEGLLSYNNSWGDFDFGASVGGNVMHYKNETLRAIAKNIPFNNAFYVAAGTLDGDTYNSIYEKEIQSVYAFANVGYKDYLFLDVTARNDWSSTLPADNRSYFYPSFSLSYLITGMLDDMGVDYNKDIVDYGKVRASWAKVGKDTDPYQLETLLGTTSGVNDLQYITYPTTIANSELKPEMVTSWELGTEWHFFTNRIGIDLTYYNSTTKNQVMKIALPYSSGVQNQWINAGNIQNKGLELQLNGDFIRTRDLTFGATFNLAKNWNKVKELYHNDALGIDMTSYSIGNLNFSSGGDVTVYAIEGEQIGSIYGTAYSRDEDGNKIIGSNGLPVTQSNVEIGNAAPDFTGSFGLNFSWKGLSANALFSFQKGGDIYSSTEYMTLHAGTGLRTEDRSDLVVEGVNESGAVNTVSVTAQAYWNSIPLEECIYDASYLKLSEISVGYTLPKKWLDKTFAGYVDNVRVSAMASNLFYLIKHTPGTTPDGAMTESSLFATAIDLCPYPATRNFGVALNISF